MRISHFEKTMNYLILVVFAAFILAPILTIVTKALTAGPGRAEGLRLANFSDAWTQGHFGQYIGNSVLVTFVVVSLSVVASVLGGYALGTMKFPGSTVLFYLFLWGIMIPSESYLIPLFFTMRDWKLTDTVWGVSLPQVAMSVAFGIYWMRTYFRTANPSISEAARIDGAGTLRALWSIHLPMGRSAVTTLIVLLFLWTWNDFMTPLIMSPRGLMRTAPLGLAFFKGQYTTDTTLQAAAAALVALPVVIVYLFLQRHFIRGMIEGAVKD